MLSPHPDIEIVDGTFRTGRFRHVLFDFDGTLSLIRQGWQDVMVPMMVDVLAACPTHEPAEKLRPLVREFVDELTGKQTIYQMLRLVEEVESRGGSPEDALDYKHRYLDLLWQRIEHRVAGLEAGRIAPVDMQVPGTTDILSLLQERGATCYLASGTDVDYVRSEAKALGLADCFRGGIYGAIDDWRSYSKAQIIAAMFAEHGLSGEELLTFGDGFVEIENTIAVGGVAVGVASNEETGHGIDPWKRERLIRAGAQIIIPNFAQAKALVELLFAESA